MCLIPNGYTSRDRCGAGSFPGHGFARLANSPGVVVSGAERREFA